jgi:hypothetical protein
LRETTSLCVPFFLSARLVRASSTGIMIISEQSCCVKVRLADRQPADSEA